MVMLVGKINQQSLIWPKLDMNLHYLELKTYLLEHHPEVVMDKDYIVFRSEQQQTK